MASPSKVIKDIGKRLGPMAREFLEKQAPNFRDKVMSNPAEQEKNCGVCGRRIATDAKFFLTRRFNCRVCGHRTHVTCAANLDARLCQNCSPIGAAGGSRSQEA